MYYVSNNIIVDVDLQKQFCECKIVNNIEQ